MQPKQGERGGFGGGLLLDPYDSFMHHHLSYYGYFQGRKMGAVAALLSPHPPQVWGCSVALPKATRWVHTRAPGPWGTPRSSVPLRRSAQAAPILATGGVLGRS